MNFQFFFIDDEFSNKFYHDMVKDEAKTLVLILQTKLMNKIIYW